MSYPLEAAGKVRDAEQARAEDALSQAIERREQAVRARDEAQSALGEFRRKEAERMARELERQGRGCFGAELARAERFRSEQAAVDQRLVGALAKTNAHVRAADEAIAAARAGLTEAAIGVQAIEDHRERWESERAREKERAEERER